MPNTLYHYTSYDALVPILSSHELWASSIHYLNDGSEFQYAFTQARAQLDYILRSDSRHAELAEYLYKALERYDLVDVFVASFSENGDLLSQWRAYCAAAQGVSIGLDIDSLRAAAEIQHCRLLQCVYDRNKQERVIAEWFEKAAARWDPAQPTTQDIKAHLASEFALAFTTIAPQLKNPAFAEEREWRIVSDFKTTDDVRVGYRPGRSFIVPYFRFQLPEQNSELYLHELIIGPTPHAVLAYFSLKGLLRAKGVRRCRVTNTAVPYRTW